MEPQLVQTIQHPTWRHGCLLVRCLCVDHSRMLCTFTRHFDENIEFHCNRIDTVDEMAFNGTITCGLSLRINFCTIIMVIDSQVAGSYENRK